MIHVLFMDVSSIEKETFALLCTKLDRERLAKVNACKRYEDKVRSLGCGLLLLAGLKIVTGKLGTDFFVPAEDKLRYGVKEKGKPYFIDYPDICFNLSHSGSIAALAIGDEEVGIDVQEKKPVRDSLVKKVLSETEYDKYMTFMSEEGRTDWFFRCWCAKESVAKLTGEGLFLDFSGLEYMPEKSRIFCGTEGHSCFVREIQIDEKNIMMVCTEKETEIRLEKGCGHHIGKVYGSYEV